MGWAISTGRSSKQEKRFVRARAFADGHTRWSNRLQQAFSPLDGRPQPFETQPILTPEKTLP
jgi:hypothetical protein